VISWHSSRDNGRREGAGSRDGGKRIHQKLANWSWVSSGIVGSKISNRIHLKLVRIMYSKPTTDIERERERASCQHKKQKSHGEEER
jgi:hypothetical protein